MAELRVRLQIQDIRADDYGTVIRVALRDTSMADALHPTVAEATGVVKPDRRQIEVSLHVPDGALEHRHRYSLWAHVDHEGTGQPRPGDLITTQNVPVTADDVDGNAIEVPLTRI